MPPERIIFLHRLLEPSIGIVTPYIHTFLDSAGSHGQLLLWQTLRKSIQKEARADLAAPPVCHSGASSLSLQILHFFQVGFLSIHVSVFVWYISVTFLVAMSAYRPCFLIPVDCDVAHLKYLPHKQINKYNLCRA